MLISNKQVLMIPDLRNHMGGPAKFQNGLSKSLAEMQVQITYYKSQRVLYDAILLINATRRIRDLIVARKHRTVIVQRLGSPFPSNKNLDINSLQHLRTWIGVQNMEFIRRYLANRIVYQSQFVKRSWTDKYGSVNKPSKVIYNGVDLKVFSPIGPKYESSAEICIVSVEGTQVYPEQSPAFQVVSELNRRGVDVELLIFGRPWADTAMRYAQYPFLKFIGCVANEELPFYYRGADSLVSNDGISAACPNSVIEALACGTPVIGYEFAVLPEMLTQEAGRCVPAVGDPWKGETPGNIAALADAALEVVENREFRNGARRLAEERYGLERMVEQYIEVLFG